MRFGHLALVIAFSLSGIATAAAVRPEAAAAARHLMELGVAQEQAGRHQDAVGTFTQAIATRALSRPDEARATFDRGVALDALGRTPEAIADYTSAIRLDAKLAPAFNNRGNAYRRMGRLEAAKRDYMAALRCPGVAREYPFYGLALIAQRLGDKDGARDYFHKALAVNPSFSLAAQGLASLSWPPPIVAATTARASENRPAAVRAHQEEISSHPRLRQMIGDLGGPRTRGDTTVQLGAFRDEQTAIEGWSKIVAATGGILEGFSPITVSVDIPGKGRFWRLRTVVVDKLAARKLCESLAAKGQACMLARD